MHYYAARPIAPIVWPCLESVAMTTARAGGDQGHLVVPEETMGDRMRRARRYLKLTQAEFADLIGASRERVGLWETGTRHVPLKDAARIARVLREWHRIDADWLLGLDGPTSFEGSPQTSGVDPTTTRLSPCESTNSVAVGHVRRLHQSEDDAPCAA